MRAASTTRRRTPSSICGSVMARAAREAYEAEARSIAALMLHRDLAQPGARIPAAGSAQEPGRQVLRRVPARACRGRGRHGRRYRGVVRGARHEVTLQDRARGVRAPGAQARARVLRQEAAQRKGGGRGRSARLRMDLAGDGAAQADVVIEAIFENAEAKRELYAKLEPRMKASACSPPTLPASMLEQLAQKLRDPGRLVGLHFFNPVAKMPLVEVISVAADASRSQRRRAWSSRASSTSCLSPAAARRASS